MTEEGSYWKQTADNLDRWESAAEMKLCVIN